MTIFEALQFCKATGRAVCRPGSMSTHVKWDPDWTYKFSGADILADDWEDAEAYMSGKPSLEQGGLKGMSTQELSGKPSLEQGGLKWMFPQELSDKLSLEHGGLSPQELSALREAATSVVGVSERWSLQTSNSFRRIGTVRGDGNVLHGTKHHYDGHPDLQAAPGVLDYIVAAQPRVVIGLIENLEAVTIKFLRALDFAKACLDRQGDFLKEITEIIVEYERSNGSAVKDRFVGARKSLEDLREAFVDIQR